MIAAGGAELHFGIPGPHSRRRNEVAPRSPSKTEAKASPGLPTLISGDTFKARLNSMRRAIRGGFRSVASARRACTKTFAALECARPRAGCDASGVAREMRSTSRQSLRFVLGIVQCKVQDIAGPSITILMGDWSRRFNGLDDMRHGTHGSKRCQPSVMIV